MASEPTASTGAVGFYFDTKKFCNLKLRKHFWFFPNKFRAHSGLPLLHPISSACHLDSVCKTMRNSFSTESVVRVRGRFIAVGFILLTIIKAGAAQDRIDDFRNAGAREYRAGNFDAAEALFLQAKKAAVSAGNRDLEALIDNDLGNLEMGADRPMKADQFYHSALAIFRAMPDKHSEIATTLLNLAYVDALRDTTMMHNSL